MCFAVEHCVLTLAQSHQNKFHAGTIRYLTNKFGSITEGDSVTQHDKELWEYFASLYKNSNKGIKGRGKDRKISASGPSSATPATNASNDGQAPLTGQAGSSGRITPPTSNLHMHAQSAPVSPTHGVVNGRIMKRGPSSVQMSRDSSRSSSGSSSMEDMVSAVSVGAHHPHHQHAAIHGTHAYDFNAGHLDMAFPERKLF
jgi:hypothetical protein